MYILDPLDLSHYYVLRFNISNVRVAQMLPLQQGTLLIEIESSSQKHIAQVKFLIHDSAAHVQPNEVPRGSH